MERRKLESWCDGSLKAIGERLLAKAGHDAMRWGALLEHWANFDLKWRVTAGQRLARAAAHFSDGDLDAD